MGLLSQLFNRPVGIRLTLVDWRLRLQCLQGDSAAGFFDAAAKWPQLSELRRWFPRDGASEAEIPFGELEQVRAVMEALRARYPKARLQFEIDPVVKRLTLREEAPEGFAVRYVRQGPGLRRELPEGAHLLADGWFLMNDACWQYAGLPQSAQSSLADGSIPPERLLAFLTEHLPAMRKAGVPVESALTYDQLPALRLELCDVQWNSVVVRSQWAVAPSRLEADFPLPGHVLAGGVVRPGLAPGLLRSALPDPGQECLLRGVEIARFLEQYEPLRPFLTGQTALFEQTHRWAAVPYSWWLRVTPGQRDGAVRPMAEPAARIGGKLVSVPELLEAQREAYWHFPGGWARQADLLALGVTGQNQRTKAAFALSAKQLLYRGDAGLANGWTGMAVTGPAWLMGGGKHAVAAAHLAYLAGWGLRGGLTGGYEALMAYGLPLIARLMRENRDAQVLIAASAEDADALRQAQAVPQASVVPYHRVAQDDRANTTQWHLLVLVEPDAWQSAPERNHIMEAARLSARRMLVFCQRAPAALDANHQAWLAALLDCGKTPEVLPYLIRDCRRALPLPEPFRNAAQPSPGPKKDQPVPRPDGYRVTPGGEEGIADIELDGPRPKNEPIPPRPGVMVAPGSEKGIRFLDEARKLAAYVPEKAQPATFSAYQPVYADMDVRQRVWYFHLRAQWRRGEYPDADLAYLLVHVYELVQLVGVRDAQDGYRQLMALWKAYAKRQPTLTQYLSEWMGDYIRVRDCGVTEAQLLAEAPAVGARGLNAALGAMAEELPLNVPLWVLEKLSGYRASGSKFSQRGNQALMDSALPGAVTHLDEQLRLRTKKGLLDTYAPLRWRHETVEAFAGAPVAQSLRYTLRLRRYETGERLGEYLRQVMRGTENLLRARRGFSAKLQGVTLDDQTRAWLEAYVEQLLPRQDAADDAAQDKPREKINLDLSQLSLLREESDAVRDALLATLDDPEPEDAAAAPEPAPVPDDPDPVPDPDAPDDPDHDTPLLSPDAFAQLSLSEESVAEADSEPDEAWQRFFEAADPEALRAALEGAAALAAYARAKRQMPDVVADALNGLALECIGDLIVGDEGVVEDYRETVEAYLRKE